MVPLLGRKAKIECFDSRKIFFYSTKINILKVDFLLTSFIFRIYIYATNYIILKRAIDYTV